MDLLALLLPAVVAVWLWRLHVRRRRERAGLTCPECGNELIGHLYSCPRCYAPLPHPHLRLADDEDDGPDEEDEIDEDYDTDVREW